MENIEIQNSLMKEEIKDLKQKLIELRSENLQLEDELSLQKFNELQDEAKIEKLKIERDNFIHLLEIIFRRQQQDNQWMRGHLDDFVDYIFPERKINGSLKRKADADDWIDKYEFYVPSLATTTTIRNDDAKQEEQKKQKNK